MLNSMEGVPNSPHLSLVSLLSIYHFTYSFTYDLTYYLLSLVFTLSLYLIQIRRGQSLDDP